MGLSYLVMQGEDNMKKLALFVLLLFAVSLVASLGFAQDKNKKVIQTHTDEKGFQRDLTEVDLMYQTAKQYMSAGMHEKAAEELERVVSADSTRKDVWHDLAKTYSTMKMYDKAANALGRAHRQFPKDIYLLSSLGYAQVNAGDLESAIQTYQQMLIIDTVSYDANVHLAFIYQKQGDNVKAIEYYEKALQGNESDIQTMGTLAKLYSDIGEEAKSLAMYEKVCAAAPDNETLRTRLGAAYITAQNFQEAARIFKELVALNSENPTYQLNLGISLSQLKQTTEAVAAIEKAIELKPDAGIAYQHLANLYNDNNQYAKAAEAAKKGVELTENNAGLYCAWGKALEKMKQFDAAISKFKQAVDDPQYGSYARKQIDRQEQLKIREQKIKEQQG